VIEFGSENRRGWVTVDLVQESSDRPPAAGGRGRIDWSAIAGSPEFAQLAAARRRMMLASLGVFVLLVGVFFILCGYARSFMSRSVDGGLTVAYVWLLGLTVLAWILVWMYLRFAERRLEPAAQELARRLGVPGPEDEAP
jgi:uncharacterized membrane protein (DUF485 family)